MQYKTSLAAIAIIGCAALTSGYRGADKQDDLCMFVTKLWNTSRTDFNYYKGSLYQKGTDDDIYYCSLKYGRFEGYLSVPHQDGEATMAYFPCYSGYSKPEADSEYDFMKRQLGGCMSSTHLTTVEKLNPEPGELKRFTVEKKTAEEYIDLSLSLYTRSDGSYSVSFSIMCIEK